MKIFSAIVAGLLGIILFAGCASNRDKILDSGISTVELRSYQSRAFDTTDREKTLRAVISTLQDLEFIIEEANAVLGTVSANKFSESNLRITVSVRPRGKTQILVRASLQWMDKPVHEPEPYREFFNALSKEMFLDAQEAK